MTELLTPSVVLLQPAHAFMARTPSVCLSVCLFGVLRYLSISNVLSMHDRASERASGLRARWRFPIHTLSEYCAADAIAATAAATGAVNASASYAVGRITRD